MAIIGLLSILAQPNYSTLWQKHLIITTVKTIQHCLQYARVLAITKYTTIIIKPIQSNSHTYGIVIKNHKQTLKTYYFHKNINIAWHGFGAQKDKIYIYPNGISYNNGHFIVKCQKNLALTYTLIVSKTLKTHVEHN